MPLSIFMCVCSVIQSSLILCKPMNCSPAGSSGHAILQAIILEWVAISLFRGSSQPRDQTCISCLAGRFFTTEPPGKPLNQFTKSLSTSALSWPVTKECKKKRSPFGIYNPRWTTLSTSTEVILTVFYDMTLFPLSLSPLVLLILHSKQSSEHGQLKLILLMVPGGMAECLTSLSLKKFYLY